MMECLVVDSPLETFILGDDPPTGAR